MRHTVWPGTVCTTVLINCHSFFHNKRCRRSNYSVRHICSQGDAATCYQLELKGARVTLQAIPKLLSKIYNFLFHFNRATAKNSHAHIRRQEVFVYAKCLHVTQTEPLSLFDYLVVNQNAIQEMWLLWHIACYSLNVLFVYRHISPTAMSYPFK